MWSGGKPRVDGKAASSSRRRSEAHESLSARFSTSCNPESCQASLNCRFGLDAARNGEFAGGELQRRQRSTLKFLPSPLRYSVLADMTPSVTA
jgi:hypothetical protein